MISNEKIEELTKSLAELKAAREQEIEELRIKWVKGQDEATGNSQASWGYGEPPHSLEEFYARLEGLVVMLMDLSDNVWGYCYS